MKRLELIGLDLFGRQITFPLQTQPLYDLAVVLSRFPFNDLLRQQRHPLVTLVKGYFYEGQGRNFFKIVEWQISFLFRRDLKFVDGAIVRDKCAASYAVFVIVRGCSIDPKVMKLLYRRSSLHLGTTVES